MRLYFYKLGDYNTFDEAKKAKAVRSIYLEDVENPSLNKGQAADIVNAVMEAIDLMDGSAEVVEFVLTDDDDKLLDIL